MRVPLSWLAEQVHLTDRSTDAVLAALVKVGLEEEDVHRFDVSGPLVVGQVLSAEPEPQSNGKTINWCQVRVAPEGQLAADGGADVRGIVCGAHNFVVGDKVVVTLPGSVLPGGFAIAARKTYGHVSDGMMASARELGLGEDHNGIIVLAALGLDPEVGTLAIPLLGLDDAAVEINVTPDRGYAFSIRGVAREYAHSTGVDFRDPVLAVGTPALGSGFPVEIRDEAPIRGQAGVRSFVTRVVEGVDAKAATPPWMLERLTLAGIRSVSVIVDVTNYVMLETGQPIHAYDLDTVDTGLIVRRAQAGEHLTTLDGKERSLDAEDLVIADHSGPIGLAGVMGGAATEVSDATNRVLVEAAAFEPVSIARTARRHKLPSEASKRYERGVDPTIAAAAAQRVVDLIIELAGGTATELGSSYADVPATPAIQLPIDAASKLVGVEYGRDEVISILRQIGAEVVEDGDVLQVTPPSWRPDLTEQVDLIEEVARIADYTRIPSRLPVAPPGRGYTTAQQSRRRIARHLAGAGYTEVFSYPFVSAAQNALFESAELPSVELANALDAKEALLRRLVLPGLLTVARRNVARGLTDLAIYEQEAVFRPQTGQQLGIDELPVGSARPTPQQLAALGASLPDQPRHLAAVITGQTLAKQPGVHAVPVDWQEAAQFVVQAGLAAGVSLTLRSASVTGLHPGRSAEVVAERAEGAVVVGFAGELHPDIAHEYALTGRVAVAEIDLDALIALSPEEVKATPVHTQTPATQDLSLVVPADTAAAAVLRAVIDGAGELLEHVALVDDYRGEGIEPGFKSLTFALRFRALDRTLTAAEASEARDAAVALAAERLGATPRV
ncbi:phenylalanine--tRNA ligase subunit beta [Pseudoclavibacter soli]|uniref:phenylalanine--tRNA ligase subunit beta n=1 Tax=Pseudoclavibacter soli TaxID=452623 RepID=UPI0004278D3C|nr:phenylalanine--tRNA ligase subunit beta [Pseudoclavibacter soli]